MPPRSNRDVRGGSDEDPTEPVVDPAIAPWDPPARPTLRQRASSGALAAAMVGLGEVLEPSRRREEAPVEAEAPGEPEDGYELVFDPRDPTSLTVVLRAGPSAGPGPADGAAPPASD